MRYIIFNTVEETATYVADEQYFESPLSLCSKKVVQYLKINHAHQWLILSHGMPEKALH